MTEAQAKMLNYVKSRNFIIGSIDPAGNFSVAEKPFFHADKATAFAELDRLAMKNPQNAYVALYMAGGAKASTLAYF